MFVASSRLASGITLNLIFFDIDGTLLISPGAGGRAITRIMKSTFNLSGEIARIEIHGQTDRGIATQLFKAHGIEDSALNWKRFKNSYLEVLDEELTRAQGCLLPGIQPLLHSLQQSPTIEVALLTGNIEIAAFKKIKHFGIDQYFSWGGFGDQHRDRSDMARAAIKLAGQRKEINSIENVYVIGDTPNDIRCGKAINAITIAVATASYSAEQLSDYDPDWLFPDLSDLDMILSLLN